LASHREAREGLRGPGHGVLPDSWWRDSSFAVLPAGLSRPAPATMRVPGGAGQAAVGGVKNSGRCPWGSRKERPEPYGASLIQRDDQFVEPARPILERLGLGGPDSTATKPTTPTAGAAVHAAARCRDAVAGVGCRRRSRAPWRSRSRHNTPQPRQGCRSHEGFASRAMVATACGAESPPCRATCTYSCSRPPSHSRRIGRMAVPGGGGGGRLQRCCRSSNVCGNAWIGKPVVGSEDTWRRSTMRMDPHRRATARAIAVLAVTVGLAVAGCGSTGSGAGATQASSTAVPAPTTPTAACPTALPVPRGAAPVETPTGPVTAVTPVPRGAAPVETPSCAG
jgi:hypothetical protein